MADDHTWVAPDGVRHPLSASMGIQGRFSPDVQYEATPRPVGAGSTVTLVRHADRTVQIPIIIEGTGPDDLRANVRILVAALDPTRGPGRLEVATGTTVRELLCRLIDGAGLDESAATRGTRFQKAVLTFRSSGPYWQDAAETIQTFTVAASTATFFGNPFFPLNLAASEVLVDTSIDNDGDVDAWPVWTIVGPASDITVRNVTTGRRTRLDVTLAEGETITVDTQPGAKTVTDHDGVSRFDRMSGSLWPLTSGVQRVWVEAADATDATSIELAWRRRWLGP
jgi:hypothetical protein